MTLFFRIWWPGAVMAGAMPAAAADWHVDPAGDDAAAGNAVAPFATVQRAQTAAAPGDRVILHGGTWRPQPPAPGSRQGRRSLYACGTLLDKSGRPGAPIRYEAAPGETPVFDFRDFTPPGRRIAAFGVYGSWIEIRGVEVTGVQVTQKGHTQSVCFLNYGSHNRYEGLRMHDGQAIGVYLADGAENLFLNCDAWANHDFTSEDGRGGNVDGFGCHAGPGGTGNVFRGCRAWLNSDDGFDLISAGEPVLIENCWAFSNGFGKDGRRLADGNGFKAGGYGSTPVQRMPRRIPRHIVRGCIAAGNKSSGFYANHHPGGIDWVNNTASGNGVNFNFLNRLDDNRTDVPGYDHRIVHNLAWRGREVSNLDAGACDVVHNSFTDGLRPGVEDFVSTDAALLLAPRQEDGSLPETSCLRPVAGSGLARQEAGSSPLCPGVQPWLGALRPAGE